jgi:NADH-quinone oxidoreductase subunit N
LTAGFIGKFYVFRAGYHDAGALVVIALVASAIAAFFYLRIVVLMFFADPPADGPTVAIPSWTTTVAITAATFATILLGVVPQLVLDWASSAATLVR